MKKNILLIFVLLSTLAVKAQEINTQKISNWSTLRKSGFFESNIENALNAPGKSAWYWGINIGHTANTSTTSPYYYSGQILFSVNTDNKKPPTMFIRSTDINGKGVWARVIHNQGNQSIGGDLSVNGLLRCKEIKVEATGWADFVFSKEYNLPTLQNVEKYIMLNKTLPGIPSEKEVKENGVDLGEMQVKMLQKIEELTLYIIEQDKKITEQNNKILELEKRLK